MKSKAPLALMEQLIMLTVFALAAALCVQTFAVSDHISRSGEARDQAMLLAQNMAETIKSYRGDGAQAAAHLGGVWEETQSGAVWRMDYDKGGLPTQTDPAYSATVTLGADAPDEARLGGAEISVSDAGGEIVAELSVKWQREVDGDA